MTDDTQPSLGTVAEEAARLIAAMATMARSSAASDEPSHDATHEPSHGSNHDSSPYDGWPAHEQAAPDAERPSGPTEAPHPSGAPSDGHWAGPSDRRACSACGGDSDGTPVACKLCPLCQGIALLRTIRPETVDRLADLASAMAASLRDVATQSRASGPASDARTGSARPSHRGHATVQDIPVDDEDEG